MFKIARNYLKPAHTACGQVRSGHVLYVKTLHWHKIEHTRVSPLPDNGMYSAQSKFYTSADNCV